MAYDHFRSYSNEKFNPEIEHPSHQTKASWQIEVREE
jgi:hypothetical protein